MYVVQLQHGMTGGVALPAFFRAGMIESCIPLNHLGDAHVSALEELRGWLLWITRALGAFQDFKVRPPLSLSFPL